MTTASHAVPVLTSVLLALSLRATSILSTPMPAQSAAHVQVYAPTRLSAWQSSPCLIRQTQSASCSLSVKPTFFALSTTAWLYAGRANAKHWQSITHLCRSSHCFHLTSENMKRDAHDTHPSCIDKNKYCLLNAQSLLSGLILRIQLKHLVPISVCSGLVILQQIVVTQITV